MKLPINRYLHAHAITPGSTRTRVRGIIALGLSALLLIAGITASSPTVQAAVSDPCTLVNNIRLLPALNEEVSTFTGSGIIGLSGIPGQDCSFDPANYTDVAIGFRISDKATAISGSVTATRGGTQLFSGDLIPGQTSALVPPAPLLGATIKHVPIHMELPFDPALLVGGPIEVTITGSANVSIANADWLIGYSSIGEPEPSPWSPLEEYLVLPPEYPDWQTWGPASGYAPDTSWGAPETPAATALKWQAWRLRKESVGITPQIRYRLNGSALQSAGGPTIPYGNLTPATPLSIHWRADGNIAAASHYLPSSGPVDLSIVARRIAADPLEGERIFGTYWVSGPGLPEGGVAVPDCVAIDYNPCPTNSLDRDPGPGRFALDNLIFYPSEGGPHYNEWFPKQTYKIKQTKIPEGMIYNLDPVTSTPMDTITMQLYPPIPGGGQPICSVGSKNTPGPCFFGPTLTNTYGSTDPGLNEYIPSPANPTAAVTQIRNELTSTSSERPWTGQYSLTFTQDAEGATQCTFYQPGGDPPRMIHGDCRSLRAQLLVPDGFEYTKVTIGAKLTTPELSVPTEKTVVYNDPKTLFPDITQALTTPLPSSPTAPATPRMVRGLNLGMIPAQQPGMLLIGPHPTDPGGEIQSLKFPPKSVVIIPESSAEDIYYPGPYSLTMTYTIEGNLASVAPDNLKCQVATPLSDADKDMLESNFHGPLPATVYQGGAGIVIDIFDVGVGPTIDGSFRAQPFSNMLRAAPPTTMTVSFTPPLRAPITSTCYEVNMASTGPHIEVTKLGPRLDAANPGVSTSGHGGYPAENTLPVLNFGQEAKWTYIVKNTGTEKLLNITLNDNRIFTPTGLNCPFGKTTLDPGESMECTGTGNIR